MKTLIAAFLTLVTVNAFAATVRVYETAHYGSSFASGTFEVNEEMGRAWVEISIPSSMPDSDPDYSRVKVPGLSLVGGVVVLDVEGQQVECAKVKPVGIFRYRVARATGKCVFKSKIETRVYDDGFETRKVRYLVVDLVTK